MSNIQFFTKTTEEIPAGPLQTAPGSAAIHRAGAPARSNQEILKMIRCNITNPTELDNGPDRSHWFRAVQTGFSLKLPPDARLIWCRFRAVIAPVARKDEPVLLLSLHPEEIRQPTSFRDDLFLGEHGLERPAARPKDRPDQIVHFDSFLSGYKTGQQVQWDFSPDSGTLSPGSNRLLIGLSTSAYYPLKLTASLQFTLYHPQTGELSLELPAESRKIR
ncbi:MAG: hypothetical protein V4577_04425 [Bacteroidota bacterium]